MKYMEQTDRIRPARKADEHRLIEVEKTIFADGAGDFFFQIDTPEQSF